MRLSVISSIAMIAGVTAAATIPLLSKIDSWGFVNLDIDGVLRSWSSSGTVLEAAALSPQQTTEFINMREGIVEPQRTIDEKVIFVNVNGLDVPEAQLLDPPQHVIPSNEIANAKANRLLHKNILPPGPVRNTLDARSCVPAYCSGQNYQCEIYVRSLPCDIVANPEAVAL